MLPTRTHDVLVRPITRDEIPKYEAEGWEIEPNSRYHAIYAQALASRRVLRKSKGESP